MVLQQWCTGFPANNGQNTTQHEKHFFIHRRYSDSNDGTKKDHMKTVETAVQAMEEARIRLKAEKR